MSIIEKKSLKPTNKPPFLYVNIPSIFLSDRYCKTIYLQCNVKFPCGMEKKGMLHEVIDAVTVTFNSNQIKELFLFRLGFLHSMLQIKILFLRYFMEKLFYENKFAVQKI